MEFLVNAGYYITDAIVIFPCIPIILSMRRNDPFIFHWFLITLSVFVIVLANLGYTFVASINDELLKNIEWLWSFVFSVGYILLTVSIIRFSKIKQILEYRKFSESLKNEKPSGGNNLTDAFIEKCETPIQILKTMTDMTEKAESQIDILFARYFIHKKDIIKFINMLAEKTRKNKFLNVRIILPSPKLDEDIPSNTNTNISIKYFDRHLRSNAITSILDSEFMYVMGSESENKNDGNQYYLQNVNMESKKLVYTALFERMWMLEKSVDVG